MTLPTIQLQEFNEIDIMRECQMFSNFDFLLNDSLEDMPCVCCLCRSKKSVNFSKWNSSLRNYGWFSKKFEVKTRSFTSSWSLAEFFQNFVFSHEMNPFFILPKPLKVHKVCLHFLFRPNIRLQTYFVEINQTLTLCF